ncbi:putative G-protein coupled receptor CG31760 [Tubulanus polymorphus]|uniref:putative G-protein coupled receptor CG31760 n=1 Tax=Tubulanus polymorphus TaxID=672921 RepID=UPI003DA5CE71
MVALVVLLFLGSRIFLVTSARDDSKRLESARNFLRYVDQINPTNCNAGTGETISVKFDTSIWNKYADVAVKSANLISKMLVQSGDKFNTSYDPLLYDIVRNNVAGKTLIFGSAIALEPNAVPLYGKFSPYASRQGGIVTASDLSLGYDYLDNVTEWYSVLKERNWMRVPLVASIVNYRVWPNDTILSQTLTEPLAKLSDGHWTDPYFDCQAGDIWMVTYSAPILSSNFHEVIVEYRLIFFRGVATIDIELKEIDINQCDTNSTNGQSTQAEQVDKSRSVDVFRDTHVCPISTICEVIRGQGFKRGSYKCVCADGYYFPDVQIPPRMKYFNGSQIEAIIGKNDSNIDVKRFECLKCRPGCDTCVDSSPCLYEFILTVRIIILIITALMVFGIIFSTYVIWLKRNCRIIKAASPIFLYIMAVGAILMCSEVFLEFPEATGTICMIKPWPSTIGFFGAYGALLLKTWRISAIIKIQTAKKLQLSDKELLKRFLPILGIAVVFLVAWTVAVPLNERVQIKKTSSGLKYPVCSSDWWMYGVQIGQVVLLVWGAYLCYLIRKAPSHLNESKYITWCIYNTVLLGTFILIIRELIAGNVGPDMLYGMLLLRLQVHVTSMVLLIFVPKFYALYRGVKDEDLRGAGTMNRQTEPTITSVDVTHRSTQTEASWVDLCQRGRPTSTSSNTGERLRNNKVHPAE